MIIQPAREDPQGELSGIGLEAFDIADAESVGLFGQESLEVPLQLVDALLQARIALREDGLVEIDVPLIVLGLLAREAIDILAQCLVAVLAHPPAQRPDEERLEVRDVQARRKMGVREYRIARDA